MWIISAILMVIELFVEYLYDWVMVDVVLFKVGVWFEVRWVEFMLLNWEII